MIRLAHSIERIVRDARLLTNVKVVWRPLIKIAFLLILSIVTLRTDQDALLAKHGI